MGIIGSLQQPHPKLFLHIAQIILILAAIILTIMLLSSPSNIPSRAQTMILAFGFKSYVFIAYQLLTEYNRKFSRWASLKANFVLNTIDIVFWLAAIVLGFMGISARCFGTTCVYQWIMIIVAVGIFVSFVLAAYASFKEWRACKRGVFHAGMNSSKYYNQGGEQI